MGSNNVSYKQKVYLKNESLFGFYDNIGLILDANILCYTSVNILHVSLPASFDALLENQMENQIRRELCIKPSYFNTSWCIYYNDFFAKHPFRLPPKKMHYYIQLYVGALVNNK